MIKLEKEYILITQQEFRMYSITLTVDELIEQTEVEYYDSKTNKGYQRPLIPSHYRKIAKYLQSSDPILPTAILTAVNPTQITEGRQIIINGKLRVVDGQHRIQGIKHLKDTDMKAFQKIKDFLFPVLMMVISEDDKTHEINAFININKTGKKVSTDLAIQLRDKIRGGNLTLIKDNLNESIATKVSQNVSKDPNSLWFEMIKFGDKNTKGKTISINAFNKSIKEIINNYLITNNYTDESLTYNDFDKIVEEVTLLVTRAWDIISQVWPGCFNSNMVDPNSEYNIQKGIGVFSLHIILGEQINLSDGDVDNALKLFHSKLSNSQTEEKHWLLGGDFSLYNSNTGFKHIANYIKNETKTL